MIQKNTLGLRVVVPSFKAKTGWIPRPGFHPYTLGTNKDSEVEFGFSLNTILKDGHTYLYQYCCFPPTTTTDLLSETLVKNYSFPCLQPAGGYCYNSTIRPQLTKKWGPF